ncbi:hypothetical protein SKAU_G00188260 [Synaphobranchus kaupii]|uniref:Uncharacterized protein n=1 Tax=Synaphobranchus kaupii TaxID=118154 RepID=A0A9Q1IUY1_SYNKA|nr:hypothetical protein SKAU_G00188260 [Synaphobranchus kaupii]
MNRSKRLVMIGPSISLCLKTTRKSRPVRPLIPRIIRMTEHPVYKAHKLAEMRPPVDCAGTERKVSCLVAGLH